MQRPHPAVCVALAAASCSQPALRSESTAAPLAATRSTPIPASAPALTCQPANGPLELLLVSRNDVGEIVQTCTEVRPPCKNASHPTLSADGRFVAFDSDAPSMISGLTPRPGSTQIYVRDVDRNRTELITGRVVDGQLEFSDAGAGFAEISGDGRWVVFTSSSTNLIAEDKGGFYDVFAFDRQSKSAIRISENPDGLEFNASSSDPVVSYDGEFVAFASAASNIGPLFGANGATTIAGPGDGRTHLYLASRTLRRFEWLDRLPNGLAADAGSSHPVMSEDGGVIVFSSNSTDLAGVDGNEGDEDIYACVRNKGGSIVLVSIAFNSSRSGNGVSRKPVVSGDGRYVAFEGVATDLLPPGVDTNNQSDVFVRDLHNGVTTRVSVSSTGAQANGTSGYAALSFDGRFVAFSSTARNLVPNDLTRGFLDYFVQDRDVSGDGVFDEPGDICTRRMSVTPEGVASNARSGGNCALSADGRFTVFMSESNLLVPNDTNGEAPGMKCSPTCLFGRDVFRARVY